MLSDREEPCAAIALPAGLADDLAGYAWARSNVGESGAAVYRLSGKAGAPDLFLKHGQDRIADDLVDEMVRLRWLGGYVRVPSVTQFLANSTEAWLAMTALEGQTAYQVLETRPEESLAIADSLADFLRELHAIPVAECSFSSDHRYRLRLARKRIDAGLVEEDEFDAERQGLTAEQVWKSMQQLLPIVHEPVVTHGDYSLDNLLIVDGRVIGCIDTGRVGVADRYQDLAIMWNCLGEFDDELQHRFLARYGIASPDPSRLNFHLMLDEMF